MVKNQLVEVQCRQDGCDAGRQGYSGEEGRARANSLMYKNIIITVCSSVVGVLMACPFKTLGEIKIISAMLRILTSLQHIDKMRPLDDILWKNYQGNTNCSLKAKFLFVF